MQQKKSSPWPWVILAFIVLLIVILIGCVVMALALFIPFSRVTDSFVSEIKEISETIDEYGEYEEVDRDNLLLATHMSKPVTVAQIKYKAIVAENLGSTLPSQIKYFRAPDADDPLSKPCVAKNGLFIKVTYSVTNLSSKPVHLGGLRLIDNNDNIYEAANDVTHCFSESVIFETINPDETRKFTELYRVKSNVEKLYLEVTDQDYLKNEKKYIQLSLG